jgi:methenyltetrahydromethanopterin cyclohydrolase
MNLYTPPFPINHVTAQHVETLVANAGALRLGLGELPCGARIIDAGIEYAGSIEAGRLIAEICMGMLGKVSLQAAGQVPGWSAHLCVHSQNPVDACLGSQYAGWSLKHGEGKGAFFALGSGPGRILARKEKLYEELTVEDAGPVATLVLEVDSIPPDELAQKIADECGVRHDNLNLILTPTRSMAGTTQVVARVLEVSMHKAHELHFPLQDIVDGVGSAPLPPPAPDFLNAMGRTNDAILFGGAVHLYVNGSDEAAEALANKLPSSASRDYGRPFAAVFKDYEYDFFKIDPMLFSPARVSVTALQSGRTFSAGAIDMALLGESFGVAW